MTIKSEEIIITIVTEKYSWRVVRVVEGAALEMLCPERDLGFESLTLRQKDELRCKSLARLSVFYKSLGFEPGRVCRKEKQFGELFFRQSGEVGYCCQRQRAASQKYAKQTANP